MYIDDRPTLFVMVGVSGSGKSSKAYDISIEKEAEIVSSDSLREELFGDINDQLHNSEVFQEYHKRIRDNLKMRRNVIADATNITLKSRRILFSEISGIDCRKEAIIMAKSEEDCIKDNSKRERKVPERIIKKQIRGFQIPFKEECYDGISMSHPYPKDNLNQRVNEMKCFDQQNPHHELPLFEHCLKSKKILSHYYNKKAFLEGAMLHDIGKLFTQTFDEKGIAHYYNHAEIGTYYLLSNFTELVKEVYKIDLNSFKEGESFSDGGDIFTLLFLVNYHMLPFTWQEEKTKEKWKKIFGEEKFNLLCIFNKIDQLASKINT